MENAAAELAAIVESSQDAIVGKDLHGIVRAWNFGAQRVYGYTFAEMIGKPMRLLVPRDRWGEEDNILQSSRRGERVQPFETTRIRKDGQAVQVSIAVSPVRDKGGVILGACHVARDISEHKKFEEQIRQSQRLEGIGLLAGGIAHDFNNLLTGILGNASIAAEIVPSQSAAQPFLRDVIAASHRLSGLTRQLLAYAGRGQMTMTAVNLADLVRDVNNLIQSSIPENVVVRFELNESIPPIQAVSSQIQQIVMNLLINGAEAIPEGTSGSVLVKTELASSTPAGLRPGRYICLEVHDTGAGMDADTRARIFEPFFTTKITGRGLGLAAVLGIVAEHKGAIDVVSRPGKGSIFSVWLPAYEETPLALPALTARTRIKRVHRHRGA